MKISKCEMTATGKHMFGRYLSDIGTLKRKKTKGYPDILWTEPEFNLIKCMACGFIDDREGYEDKK